MRERLNIFFKLSLRSEKTKKKIKQAFSEGLEKTYTFDYWQRIRNRSKKIGNSTIKIENSWKWESQSKKQPNEQKHKIYNG